MYQKKIFVFLLIFVGFFSVTSHAHAETNISVTSINISPTKPAINVPCTIAVTVKNIGDDLNTIQGFLDYQYNFSSFSFASVVIPTISSAKPLKKGGSVSYVFSGFFNKLGDISMSFNVNSKKSLPEKSYTDNNFRAIGEVILADDINIVSIETVPKTVTAMQNLLVKVNVRNSGARDITNSFGLQSIIAKLDDFEIIKISSPKISLSEPLYRGGTKQFVIRGRFNTTGEKQAFLEVDKENAINEFDEDNNTFNDTLNVIDQKNNDISAISFSYDLNGNNDILVGEMMTIKATIKNTGEYSFDSGEGLVSVDIEHLFDNFKLLNIVLPETPTAGNFFENGEKLEYGFEGYFLYPGENNLYFKIDKSDKLKETDEDNNDMSTKVIVYFDENEANTPHFVNNQVDFVSSSSAKVKWETNRESTGVLQYSDYNVYEYERYMGIAHIDYWPKSTASKINHEIQLNGLVPGKEYRYFVEATRNEIDANTGELYFTMPQSDDVIVSNLKNSQNGEIISVDWDTNILTPSCLMISSPGEVFVENKLSNSVAKHEFETKAKVSGEYKFYECSNPENVVYLNVLLNEVELKEENNIISENKMNEDVEEKDVIKEIKVNVDYQNLDQKKIAVKNKNMHSNLKGKIILKVESDGEAYYVNPEKEEMYYLGKPDDAFSVMREQGIGISNKDLYKMPIGVLANDIDTDGDGLADNLEDALGLDSFNSDTDGDGFNDKVELESGYSPWGLGKQSIDNNFGTKQKGKILLQVERNGESWYVNPADGKRYFLGRPADAFAVMRNLGLGISNSNFNSL